MSQEPGRPRPVRPHPPRPSSPPSGTSSRPRSAASAGCSRRPCRRRCSRWCSCSATTCAPRWSRAWPRPRCCSSYASCSGAARSSCSTPSSGSRSAASSPGARPAAAASQNDQALAYFLPGLIYNAGYGALMVLSIVTRWPVVGLHRRQRHRRPDGLARGPAGGAAVPAADLAAGRALPAPGAGAGADLPRRQARSDGRVRGRRDPGRHQAGDGLAAAGGRARRDGVAALAQPHPDDVPTTPTEPG